MHSDLLYNLALLAVDVAVVRAWMRRRDGRSIRFGLLCLAGAGVVLARVLGEGGFGAMRLLSWGIFAHGTLALAAATVFLRSSRIAIVPAVLGFALAGVAFDAFLIEPTWLETTEVEVASAKVRRAITIAIVADLQTDRIGDHERESLARALAARPDLVLLPGDFVQCWESGQDHRRVMGEFRALLLELSFGAPLGAYAVQGNVDASDWTDSFEGTGVVAMTRTQTIELGDLSITGLSMRDSFDPRASVGPSEGFHVAFGHSPDFALGDVRADLLVAGHTHGGQVRLPGLGPILTFSKIPRAWAAGTTRLPDGRTLVVSRGIGHERGPAPRLRFLCRPELALVRIVPE